MINRLSERNGENNAKKFGESEARVTLLLESYIINNENISGS